jgi:hypothetical protein
MRFACVRNPWARFVSLYFSPHREKSTAGRTGLRSRLTRLVRVPCSHPHRFDRTKFRYFICEMAARRDQASYVLEDGAIAVNQVMRFENLEQDFARMCALLGIEAALPHVNRSRRRPYPCYYESQTCDLVRELCRHDIELFGYELEPGD